MKEGQLLLREREACQLLQLSRSSLFKLRKAGLPYVQLGGSVRYEVETIKEWLKKVAGKNNEQLGSNV